MGGYRRSTNRQEVPFTKRDIHHNKPEPKKKKEKEKKEIWKVTAMIKDTAFRNAAPVRMRGRQDAGGSV